MKRAEANAYVLGVYRGSDGDATRALYQRLERMGPVGFAAMNVFRAQKASERAKKYRGGRGGVSFREMAYQKKQWSLEQLASCLMAHGDALGFRWGWGYDADTPAFEHVLYVDIPTGQISWHGAARGVGPDYPSEWCRARGMTPQRICAWVANLIQKEENRHEQQPRQARG